MGIYLDFDMDYFVRPIVLEAKDNHRSAKLMGSSKKIKLQNPETLIKTLKEKNLNWDEQDVHVFTNHKKSYTYWWMLKSKGNKLIHIDAHSDLYRSKGFDLNKMGNGDIACYNYIWYAIRDGYINEMYWVIPDNHDIAVKLNSFRKIQVGSHDYNTKIEELKRLSIDEKMIKSFEVIGNVIKIESLIHIYICTAENLPIFNEKVKKVTVATSPEFIPEEADVLIEPFFKLLKVSEEATNNILKQHREMPKYNE